MSNQSYQRSTKEELVDYKHSELTDAIINVFYHVYNTLGYGFLEKVYMNALIHELRKRGFKVDQRARIKAFISVSSASSAF